MVNGGRQTPVDRDYRGSVGARPRPFGPMLTKTTEGFEVRIKSQQRTRRSVLDSSLRYRVVSHLLSASLSFGR